MKIRLCTLTLIALVASACSTSYDVQEIEAVRDFVAANELEEVDRVRLFSQLQYHYLNDFFVTVETRRGDYLLEFTKRCRELTQREFTREMVDIRHTPNTLRSRFDTIRGCRIATMYKITELQATELHDLGDAPGDEVFLPAAEKSDDDS